MFFLLLDIESEIRCSHTNSWYWILKGQGLSALSVLKKMAKYDKMRYNLQHLTTSYNIEFRDPCGCSICSWIAAVHWSPRKNHTHCCYHKGGALSWVSQDFEILAGWWFGTFFIFPIVGMIWSNLTNIFQRGWNHQPVSLGASLIWKRRLSVMLQHVAATQPLAGAQKSCLWVLFLLVALLLL